MALLTSKGSSPAVRCAASLRLGLWSAQSVTSPPPPVATPVSAASQSRRSLLTVSAGMPAPVTVMLTGTETARSPRLSVATAVSTSAPGVETFTDTE